MRFDVVTLFPQMFAALTESGITSRALQAGLWQLRTWNPRDFTTDNYRTVDDRPYGGGPGMVMLGEPLEKLVLRPSLLVPDLDTLEFVEHPGCESPVHNVVGDLAENQRALDC